MDKAEERAQYRPTRAGARAGALVVALLLTATGCSWFGGEDDAPATGASPAPLAQPDAPVEVIGGVDPDAIEVGAPQEAPQTGQGYYFVSSLYPVSGPRLDQPALVRMELDSALPQGTPVTVAARATDTAPWRFVDARLDGEGSHVEFIVPRLATFGVLAVDPDSVRGRLGDAVDAALEEDATRPDAVTRPACADAVGAREDGYVAKSWRRATVAWCLDGSGDARVLRLTNTRGVPVRIDAPGVVERGTSGEAVRPDIDWDTWTSVVATGAAAPSGDGTATVVAPGQTLEVDAALEPGASMLVTASDDPRSRAVQVLHATVLGLAAQVEEVGLGSATTDRATTDRAPRGSASRGAADAEPAGERALRRLLASPSCGTALDAAPARLARECLGPRALARAFGADAGLLTPVLTPGAATGLVRSRLTALQRDAARVEQRLEVSRDLPDYGPLVGRFTGTGRSIVVTADGLVTESYGTAAGPVMTVGYQLSDPDVTSGTATATATVTSVQLIDRAAAGGRAPQVGQSGVLTLGGDGVVRSPFGGATYCDATAGAAGRCTDAPTAKPTPGRGSATGATPGAAVGTKGGKGAKGGKGGTRGGGATSSGAPAPTPGPAPAGR